MEPDQWVGTRHARWGGDVKARRHRAETSQQPVQRRTASPGKSASLARGKETQAGSVARRGLRQAAKAGPRKFDTTPQPMAAESGWLAPQAQAQRVDEHGAKTELLGPVGLGARSIVLELTEHLIEQVIPRRSRHGP